MECMADLLWELTALTGEDQDSMKVTLAYVRAGGDLTAARQSLGLPPLGAWPCWTVCW
jgi:hypothetical protein